MKRISPFNLAAILATLIIALPLVTVLVELLTPASDVWAHLASTVLPEYVGNTLFLLLIAGIGTAIIGTITAWLVVMCRFPGRRLFEWALVLPLAMPAYVMAYAYTDFLQAAGPVQGALRDLTGWGVRDYWFPPIRSLGGAGFVFILALFPYVYLAARAAFLQQSECVFEVARSLGAAPSSAFRRVALPMARPAIVAGMALALMETLADYGTVQYFGVPTFTTGIFRTWFGLGTRQAASQLSAILLGFVILLMALEHFSRNRARVHDTSSRRRALTQFDLAGARGWGASLFCALPVLLGFGLPGLILAFLAIDAGVASLDTRYVALIWNSVRLAAITAVIAVAIALMLAHGVRFGATPVRSVLARFAGLGYAIPGSIIAVGVLIPLAAFDNWFDARMRDWFDVSTGLLLTGSMAALVIAYLVRFLAVSLQNISAGFEQVTPSMDAAAATLGKGPTSRLFRVHMPIIRASVLTAALIVFVDVMKELPATILMRPFDFDTLAVQAHNFAADERLAEAAVPAITIVLVGLLPVILLSRLIAGSRAGKTVSETGPVSVPATTL